MAGTISKRQQARNERMLQDLLRSVPGNDRCADCAAKNPGWASWNLGVFLCMRCAALHRKLGTHVSKVKSLSMDSWSAEQVENMKTVGNVASNKTFNPSNVRPDIPVDADEVDAAIEKYIRQKYDTRTLSGNGRSSAPAARQNTGSTGTGTGSWSEEPPDLPPKPTKRFGFTLRSSSAAVPRQMADRITPPLSPAYTGGDRSAHLPSPKANKPSRLFGMKITTVDNNFNAKLMHMRDMGFSDNAKNTEMLKSMNGNLDKAVETLIRLGEGSKPITTPITPGPRALTPVSMGSSGAYGITIEKKSSNPWEIREKPTDPIRRSTSVPPQSSAPAPNSWNPFLQPLQTQQQSQQSLESSFQSLSMSATSSPGPQSYGNQQAYYQNNAVQSSNPWQQDKVQQLPQQQMVNATFGQEYQQAPAAPQFNTSGNPFMQQAQQQQSLSPTNPWAQQSNPWSQQPAQQQSPAVQQPSNPFGTSWQQQSFTQQPVASPQPIYIQQTEFFSQPQQAQQQQPVQPQPQFQAQSQSQQVQQQQAQQQYAINGQNPWPQQMQQPTGMPQQQFQQASPQPQPQAQQQQPPFDATAYHQQFAQQAARHDKSSILALYNQPQLAPQRPLQTLPEDGTMAAQPSYDMPQRSVTMPVAGFGGSANTFGQVQAQQQQVPQHRANESVDFQGFAGNGRHSPDAFAGLSARYMR